jgi:YjbE family integral membrane protein
LEIAVENGLPSAAFLSSLFAVVLMDLVLAGDNALVIGLVARNLPKAKQRKAIICGTFGAIMVRGVMAILVIHALGVPGFMLAGGIAVAWISRKLLASEPGAKDGHCVAVPARTLAGAVRTIVIADAVMGIDNVLAIGGAADGSILMIALGLAISVPIIIWGSQIVIRVVDSHPWVILLGGAVLAWTSYSMVVREPMAGPWFEHHPHYKPVIAVLIFSISLAPWYIERLPDRMKTLVALLPSLLIWMLAFEVAAGVWKVPLDGLLVASGSDDLLEGLRWTGWLPLAAFELWLRDRRMRAPLTPISQGLGPARQQAYRGPYRGRASTEAATPRSARAPSDVA